MPIRTVFFIVLALASPDGLTRDTRIEVVPLVSRSAEDVLPLVLPFLEGDERAVANGSSLVIKGSPVRMGEIKTLIRQLDTAPRQLLITVVRGSNLSAEELNARAQVHVGIPLNAPSRSRLHVRGRYYATQDAEVFENSQQIRTVEGQAAVIETGEKIPVQDFAPYGIDPYGFGPDGTQFLQASTGFSVVPRITGQRHVTLAVAPWLERWNGGRHSELRSQSAQTTVRVPLGEWAEIGGQSETSTRNETGILARHYRSDAHRTRILIKVEQLPD